jgi:hypothetical protein
MFYGVIQLTSDIEFSAVVPTHNAKADTKAENFKKLKSYRGRDTAMARERRGFIVVQVWADIAYTDKDRQRQKITKPATAQTSDKAKNNLTDAEKQARKVKHAKHIIRDTIAELKRAGATDCKGSVSSRILARVGYTDEQGKRRDVIRAAESRTDARDKIKDILRDLEDDRGADTLNAARMTFADLVAYFKKHYLKPAEYVDGRKIEGVRSLKPAESAVNALKAYFGRRKLQSIRYSDLRAYRAKRLKDPTPVDLARHKRELENNPKAEVKVTRKIATVNRELDKLRRMSRRRAATIGRVFSTSPRAPKARCAVRTRYRDAPR